MATTSEALLRHLSQIMLTTAAPQSDNALAVALDEEMLLILLVNQHSNNHV